MESTAGDSGGDNRPMWRKGLVGLVRILAGCVTLLLWLWAVGALYFIDLPAFLGVTLAAALLAGSIIAFVRLPDRRRTWRCVLAVVALVAITVFLVQPSNDREWAVDQAVLPSAVVSGSSVTFSNIRRVVLDSSGEIEQVSHYSRTYQLDELQRVWFGVEYFTQLQSFAHTFVTFEFAGEQDSRFLTFSIEIRREKGESFGLMAGFYRRYELMYVVSEEREMIENRLATSEDRFLLYPIRASQESRSALLIDMIERMNRLQTEPEFYNSITSNCTNNIVRHLNRVSEKRVNPYRAMVVFPGHSDRVAYKLGLIDTDLSFARAREKFRIDARGRALIGSPNFSAEIRRHSQ